MTEAAKRARLKKNWHRITEELETSKALGPYGSSKLSEPDENGIRWVRQRTNASHEIHLGIDAQGNLWEKSYGPSENLDMSKFPEVFNRYHPTGKLPTVPKEHLQSCDNCSEQLFWDSSRTEIRKIQDPMVG